MVHWSWKGEPVQGGKDDMITYDKYMLTLPNTARNELTCILPINNMWIFMFALFVCC